MKKNIIILGSTGSIGTNTANIIKRDKKNFKVILLSTNTNIKKIFKQARELNVKNIVINNPKIYQIAKKKYNYLNIKIFNKLIDAESILKKNKIYYSMISVSGIDGLESTLLLSKYSKNLAVVNKESIITGWSLIKKNLKKFKTNFLPIDSEHYSIFSLLKEQKISDLKKIYITASGGPFLNFPKSKFKLIKPKSALKHPNWKMGKKITIDSATLMNKVFEVIEARHIFDIPYSKISILTHPKSYVHAIIEFKNGITKMLIHEPDMKIPIFNSIYNSSQKMFKIKSLNFKIINNLNFKKVDKNKFSCIKLLNKLPNYNSLYETVLLTINDYLVYKFLNNEIDFQKLNKLIYKISNLKEFQKYKKIKPNNIDQINKLKEYVSIKMKKLSV